MDTAATKFGRKLTAEEFLATDQTEFGSAWRYELVEGAIIAHAAPSPDHGAILGMVGVAIENRLRARGRSGCRFEAGSGAMPKRQQHATARIPDGVVRCGEQPRVTFDIVSPSELRNVGQRDRRRAQLQGVEGVQEIVEIYQQEAAAHVYRRQADGVWAFEPVIGLGSFLELRSLELSIPLSEVYETVTLAPDGEKPAAD